jgi:FkbM family methyltransferase
MTILKRLAKRLPDRWQDELKRLHFSRQIKNNNFITSEPEYKILPELIKNEDWVIDVGANVGHYTKRFSELVGAHGRVLAFEPVPTTFSLLAANVQFFAYSNVTLINAAVSNKLDVVGISIPQFETGLKNYYQAHILPAADNTLTVLSVSLDSLCICNPIALIKIDAEGHESFVLKGMERILSEHRPTLIVETDKKDVIANILEFGYDAEKLKNSPNYLFKPT